IRNEAALTPEGPAKTAKLLEAARLGSSRLRNPQLHLELWTEVIAHEPGNDEALAALTTLHENAKDWSALTAVLEKQVNTAKNGEIKRRLLGKLAMLYGERLGND